MYIHVDGEHSGGAYSLSETRGARGNMPPLHVDRRNDDETFYALAGELRLFLGDREIMLRPGQAALARRGVPHTYRVESDRARWLVMNSPAGYEHFLRAAGEPAPVPFSRPSAGRTTRPVSPGRPPIRDRDPRPSRALPTELLKEG